MRSHKKSVYLLANLTEFGKTPYIDIKTFSNIGYNCVIYPVSSLRIAMNAVNLFLQDLKKTGSQKNTVEKMLTRKDLYTALHYKPG
jgi:methylisocitrate lyase